MKQMMKVYDVTLKVRGPVFVGSGEEVRKKEYIFLRNERRVLIPDVAGMYHYLKQKGLATQYERFIMSDHRLTLSDWVKERGIKKADMVAWTRYQLDCGDAVWERGGKTQIMSCIKDAYGCPYIPGSMLKGMLRTILLAHDIRSNPESYQRVKQDILQKLDVWESRNRYLSMETKKLEEIAFHKAKKTNHPADMVNDILSGMIVSDSAPLSLDDLTLCQKVEYHKDGRETRLPLLRECLKPGTEVHFTITLDESMCDITLGDIEEAIRDFAEQYYKLFSKKFPSVCKPAENNVWLGGGAGYVSKTVVYSLFGEQAVRIVPKIYQNTGVSRDHGHTKDVSLGVSPHILKKTKYQGQDYQFGECVIEFHTVAS